MFKYVILLAVFGSSLAQWFGGRNTNSFGGGSQSVGYRANPAWASVSQPFNSKGVGGPQTFSGGLDFQNQNGHGVSFGGSKTRPGGSSAWVQGNAPIINTQDHKLDAWARHQQDFSKYGKQITNSGGLDYKNVPSGVNVFGSASKSPGQPGSLTVGAGVPITDHLSVSGSRTLTPGQKPNDQVMVNYGIDF